MNLVHVTDFDWDAGNSRKGVAKHKVGQSKAEQVFFNQLFLLMMDEKHSQKELRYHALGVADDTRLLHITFTLRVAGTLIRAAISGWSDLTA